jgi:hypothetical protein
MPRFIFTFYPSLILQVDMAYSKVRWISTPSFLACVGDAHGRGEGRTFARGNEWLRWPLSQSYAPLRHPYAPHSLPYAPLT